MALIAETGLIARIFLGGRPEITAAQGWPGMMRSTSEPRQQFGCGVQFAVEAEMEVGELSLKPSGSVQSVRRGQETVGGRPQRVIPLTIAGGRAGLRRTGSGRAQHVKEGKHSGRIKLDVMVMAIVIQICLCSCVPGVSPPAATPRLCPWDADQPGRTKQRPNPDHGTYDPGGSQIPAASVA